MTNNRLTILFDRIEWYLNNNQISYPRACREIKKMIDEYRITSGICAVCQDEGGWWVRQGAENNWVECLYCSPTPENTTPSDPLMEDVKLLASMPDLSNISESLISDDVEQDVFIDVPRPPSRRYQLTPTPEQRQMLDAFRAEKSFPPPTGQPIHCIKCNDKGYLPQVGSKVSGQHDPLIKCTECQTILETS